MFFASKRPYASIRCGRLGEPAPSMCQLRVNSYPCLRARVLSGGLPTKTGAPDIAKLRLSEGPMALEPRESKDISVVQRLVREIGITEAQALELVSLIGLNWASLVREAKELMRKL